MEDKVREFLQSRFADSILREDDFRKQQSFYIKPEALVPICEALLENLELNVNFLADITSVDWLGHEEEMGGRFEVVYNLYSLTNKYRFFLKVVLPAEDPEIDSLTPLWNGANWMEREVWDMMGIKFTGHPDLTKILTPDDLEGHPLRRDFPLTYEVPKFSWNKNEPPEVIK
jgi:NADH-quinone oxidoreductase subunit C